MPQEFIDLVNKYGGKMPNAKGVPEDQIHMAVTKYGVCKVNIDTDLRLALTAKIREVFATKPAEFDPRNYLGPGREAIIRMVRRKLHDAQQRRQGRRCDGGRLGVATPSAIECSAQGVPPWAFSAPACPLPESRPGRPSNSATPAAAGRPKGDFDGTASQAGRRPPACPAREHIRAVIQDEVADLFDEIYTDPMGSLICTRNPQPPTRGSRKKAAPDAEPQTVMLACHIEQDRLPSSATWTRSPASSACKTSAGSTCGTLIARRVLVQGTGGDFPQI